VVRKPISTGQDNKEDKAYLDILDNVVAALEKTLNQHNQVAVRMVLSQYQSRIRSLQTKLETGHIDRKKEKEYSIRAWKWKKENTLTLLENGEINESLEQHYTIALDRRIGINSGMSNPFKILKGILRGKGHSKSRFRNTVDNKTVRNQMVQLHEANSRYVVGKLKDLRKTDDSIQLKKTLSDYETSLLQAQNMIADPDRMKKSGIIEENLIQVAIERDNIQRMFETGRISRGKAKKLRDNIALLETELE
jgi:CPA1 family monovalent cation:H+ antiporter